MQAILNYLDKYSDQIFILQMGFIVILIGIIFWVYFYNRKKYHNLKHQIPASVVKNYLDSIIQNSNALKSSLFRGGGLDVDADGVPSVLPLEQVGAAAGQVGISLDKPASDEGLKAEVLKLKAQIADKQSVIQDLETQNANLSGVNEQKQKRIEELEKLLAAQPAGGDVSDSGELEAIRVERDELKEELEQYAVISDDLADLKRLKQENIQLKEALGADDADDSSEIEESESALDEIASELEDNPQEEEVASDAVEKTTEEFGSEAEESVAATQDSSDETSDDESSETNPEKPEVVAQASAEETSDDSQDADYEKSAEDLLSEFEKMLG